MFKLTSKTCATLLLGAPSIAGTFTVDPTPGAGDFTSLSAAILSGSVGDGDTILVAPGTYTGAYFIDKEIRIIGTGGAAVTILDAEAIGTAMTIVAPVLIRGFSITGGGGPDNVGGVRISSSERTVLEHNVIHDNHAFGDTVIPTGGVFVDDGARALLRDNVIHSNKALSVGGVFGGPNAHFDLVRNRIIGNGGSGTATGGVLFGSSGKILSNQITGNHGTGIGGVYIAGGIGPDAFGATVDLINNTIYGNVASSPIGSVGGVLLGDGGKVTITNCSVLANIGGTTSTMLGTANFFDPPTVGSLSMSYSHLSAPPVSLPPGTFMLPPPTFPAFAAPAAATPAGPTTAGDFELLAGSAYIDAGLDGVYPVGFSPADLSGGWRFLDGGIDLGAEEFGEGCVPPRPIGIGKITSTGSRMTLLSSGVPSASTPGFSLEVVGGVAGKPGLLFSGSSESFVPLGGHWRYVKAPLARLGIQTLDAGGSTTYAITPDLLLTGETRVYQFWSRDPAHTDGSAVGLTNGMIVTFCD